MSNFLLVTLLLQMFIATVVHGQAPSRAEFELGVTSNNFPRPSSSQYNGYLGALRSGGMSSKREAAMFLAQILHESGGLQKRREDGCQGPNGCPGKYQESNEWLAECKGTSRPKGVSYYGRGYIQLTWCSNYVQASRALGKGNQLKTNPDSVAKSDDLSWGVSGWYWKTNVHNALGNSDAFGKTTKAINGQLECNGQNRNKAEQRFAYYKKVFQAFKLSGQPNPAGCYS